MWGTQSHQAVSIYILTAVQEDDPVGVLLSSRIFLVPGVFLKILFDSFPAKQP
jgi:hypothetical protein